LTAEKEQEEAHASLTPADHAIAHAKKGRRGYMYAVAKKRKKLINRRERNTLYRFKPRFSSQA
jgi:hypothetical protein